jgi:L1 cell adhesion molecule like protein
MASVGIDIGSTYSCVARWKHGNVTIVPERVGEYSIPSYIACEANDCLVGSDAKRQIIINPAYIVYDCKTMLGKSYDHPDIQAGIKHWPFKVVNDNNMPLIEFRFDDNVIRLSPVEITSLIMAYLVDMAHGYLSQPVENVVVTVPMYFDDAQRQAVKNVCQLTGIRLLRLISEPTAAILAYDLDKTQGKQINVLVFSMGGSGHEATILEIDDGIITVLSTFHSQGLGGNVIDNRLVAHLSKVFKDKTGLDISNDQRAYYRLRNACERMKKTLSLVTQGYIEIDSLYNNKDFYTMMKRDELEELCSDIPKEITKTLDQVLVEAKLSKSNIDEIVLLGGSTHIPMIQNTISEYFDGKEMYKRIPPEEICAYGAAVQAAILNGDTSPNVIGTGLIDVVYSTISIGTTDVDTCPIISRNTIIPCTMMTLPLLVSSIPGQSYIRIPIYEGESEKIADSTFLGSLKLTGLSSTQSHTYRVVLTFDVTEDRTLIVFATIPDTEIKNSITITSPRNKVESALREYKTIVEDNPVSDQLLLIDHVEGWLHNDNTQHSETCDYLYQKLKDEIAKLDHFHNIIGLSK